MIIRILLLSISLSLFVFASDVNAGDLTTPETSKIQFDGQEYLYKWSHDDLHEFTPGEQSVTEQWNDMLTVNYYPVVSTAKDLSVIVNAVLSNYKDAGGIVLGVESIPKTKLKPAEFIIAAVFGASEAAEFAMVKFQLHEGIGASIAYAHRQYGPEAANDINDWMDDNGTRIQGELTKLTDLPSYEAFKAGKTSDVVSSLDQAI